MHSSTVLPSFGTSTAVAILLVAFHQLPAGFAELAEGALGGSECDEVSRMHAVRLIGADEFGESLEALDYVSGYGLLDAFLAGEVLFDEQLLRAGVDGHQEIGAGDFGEVVVASKSGH